MKIILIANSGIGDAIHTFPLLKTLVEQNEELKITIVVSAGSKIAFDLLEINYNSIYFSPKSSIKAIPKILSTARKLRKLKADYTLVSIASMNNACALLASLSGSKNIVGHQNPAIRFTKYYNTPIQLKENQHEVLNNFELISILDKEWQSKDLQKINYQTLKGKYSSSNVKENKVTIGIHPRSGPHYWKRWDDDKFSELINLLSKDYKVKVFYGPNEELLKDVATNNHITNHKDLSLKEVAKKIADCQLFVASDTGLMHLAVSLGVKTIGIFGPTNFHWARPYGEENIVIKTDLYCQPCYMIRGGEFHCINKEFKKCLKDISVKQVYDTCLNALNNNFTN